MAGVDIVDSPMLSKCLDFCQALASQGQAFNISISIGPSFSFSMDTRSKEMKGPLVKKRTSPSTLRRNARRRAEFLDKKQQNPSSRIPLDNATASEKPKCDQCEYKAASEKGLRQHVRMKHNKPEMAAGTPEILRSQRDFSTSLTSSPLLTTREDICKNCGDPFSPGHQCEGNLGTMGCSCSNSNCCGCHHDDSCECRQSNKQTAFCDCRDISDVDCNKQLKPKK